MKRIITNLVAISMSISVIGCGKASINNTAKLASSEVPAVDMKRATINKLADQIKASLHGWTVTSGTVLIQHHLHQFRLIDENGKWVAPELAAIGDQLFPKNIDQQAAVDFVDQVAAAAGDNQFLLDFLEQAKDKDFPVLYAKFAREGATVMPDAVAYGIVLQRLTRAMYDDWRIIEVVQGIWQKERSANDVSKYMEPFDYAKLVSVEGPIKHFIAYHKSGEVPGNFLHTMLSVNILEAILVDLHEKHPNNAKAGWYLMVNRAGSATCNPKTDACPTHWADNKKGIEFAMPLPRMWADLYSVWNLSFVTRYGHFPYVFCKLLIPQVNNYKDSPEEYIYNRALALYAHLNYAYIGRADDAKTGRQEIEWKDDQLTELFGNTNLTSARKYQNALVAADPSWINWFHDLDAKFHHIR